MKKYAGFTIPELLIYMGILAVFLVILTDILGATLDLQLKSSASASVEQDSHYLLSRLNYDIHRSTSIDSPSVVGTPSSSLSLTIDGTNVTYALNENQIQITTTSGTSALTSPDTKVTNFQITRIGNPPDDPSVQIAFTLDTNIVLSGSSSSSYNYQTTILPR